MKMSLISKTRGAFYDQLIEGQLYKIYISGYLNLLSGIPF